MCFAVVALLALTIALWMLAGGREKIGIVCTVKHPQSLGSWVAHHRKIGVNVFYMYVDESDGPDPRAVRLCAKNGIGCKRYDLEWAALENGEDADPEWDQPAKMVFKHVAVVNDALLRAARDGVSWLFHVDIDELLGPVGNSILGAMAGVPENADTIYFDNVELLPETPHMRDCLREGNLFRTDPRRFLHYANGKGGARPVAGVSSGGPHRFNPSPGGIEHHIPGHRMVVYHYVSCNLREMTEKIKNMGQYTSFFGEVPFHIRNMKAAAVCLAGPGKECDDAMHSRFVERMSAYPGESLARIRPYAA